MIHYTHGNLLEAKVEALVNTVNTVGVMGKGIALMFKEAFRANFKEYEAASKRGDVQVGRMFVTERLGEPRWIINFPTKKHWRQPSRLEWIVEGLKDLRQVVQGQNIRSIAVPPLGCGNGGLRWDDVRPEIERALGDLPGVAVHVYEPTSRYQNVPKRTGAENLTPARALIVELVRRYSLVLGVDCSLLEIQKLAWFLEREIRSLGLPDPLDLQFEPNRYGPYAHRLHKLLDGLDGSFLHSEVRLADARPLDVIAFVDGRRAEVEAYLQSDATQYLDALEETTRKIDGFESPLGLELLATVDWLLYRDHRDPNVEDIKSGLVAWPGGRGSGQRKLRLFDDRLVQIALDRLAPTTEC